MNGTALRPFQRYLERYAANAGVRPRSHADLAQEFYAELLAAWGREVFDATLDAAADQGIDRVLSRETTQGVEFHRTLDRVKKRYQRERYTGPLTLDLPEPSTERQRLVRADLAEAIELHLSDREAMVIRMSLDRLSPLEIAARLGLTPKTISNDKSRALAKLRAALTEPAAAP